MDRPDDIRLDLGVDHTGAPIMLPLSALDTHAQVLAPTGYGKSRLLARMAQELVAKTDEAVVVLDPAGDLANHLRRWTHENGHEDRLVVIDPRDDRMVCGLNPVRPWTDDHALQAGVLRDVIRHALGSHETSANAPLAGQWIMNFMCALLECGLTMAELVPLLDYTDSTFRDAVIRRMKPSIVKNEFAWLAAVLGQSGDVQSMRLLNEQLGSTARRLRQFATNAHLQRMLAGQQHAIDWGWVLDHGKFVVVNLSLEENALTEEDQRLVGQLIVSSLIRTSFARPEGRRRPLTLILDEAGKFASPETATVLNEGRKFLFRLVLAHQTLSQFVRQPDNDRSLLDAVMNNARLKIVFGGLGASDAITIGQTLFGHFGDPDRRKLELHAPVQLSHVVESVTTSSSAMQAHGLQLIKATSESQAESDSYGTSQQTAIGSMRSAGEAIGQGVSHAYELPMGVEGFYTESTVVSTGAGESEAVADGSSEQHGSTSTQTTSVARGKSIAWSRGRTVTRGKMVVPGEPFEITTSVQFESLEEQLHRFVSTMVRLPNRHAVLAFGKGMPTLFRVADVPEPRVTLDQASLYDLRVMRRQPCYAEPETIELEIAERRRLVLGESTVEIVDTAVAISRRRAARRRDGLGDDDHHGSAVPAPTRPRRPRGGHAAAKVPVLVEGAR